jgi:hypothetical protein
MIFQKLISDDCKKVILEKPGKDSLETGRFTISTEEASVIDKQHRGHQCHIEAVERE